ncbi:MAG: penicillin-binding protein activator [Robiginitomaculum sp.]|nr:MAG: penicillin-binding protein activator [Robiginitomaculum sp.]
MVIDPRAILSLCLTSLLLVSCVTDDGQGPPGPYVPAQPPVVTQPEPDPEPTTDTSKPSQGTELVLPHTQGRTLVRIALLLPFSAKSTALQDQARSMLAAAELAVFESGDLRLVLIPKDTGGTSAGADHAARTAIEDGADILVGPLLARSVSAAAKQARPHNIPLISFSTDQKVAGNGVYLMSFQPENEISRIIDFASKNGHFNFALLRGQTAYGRRVEKAMLRQALANGGSITDIEIFPRETNKMRGPASRIAHTVEREEALDAWQLAGGIGDPALDPEFAFELPYTAVLLPESGIRLQSLAPLLPYFDVDPRKTKFLGTSLWHDESLYREPALLGGWFPGPDPQSMEAFLGSYQRAYSQKPERLAPLAYDAIRIAGIISEADDDGQIHIRRDWLEDENGFTGATGLFRFSKNGLVEHQLAVFEMRRGRFEVIDPAPTAFDLPSF